MPNVWPALDDEGVSLTVLDHNGSTIPVNGVTVTGAEYLAYYSNIVFAGRLLTYDPIGTGGLPNTLYSAGALDAVTSDAVLGTIRGDFDGQQAKTNDNNFWKWIAASTLPAAPADSAGNGVLVPDVSIAGRWRQTLPTGSGATTLSGDTTGPSAGNTVVGIRGIPFDAATPTLDQVPVFDGSKWVPAPAPGGTAAGDVTGPVGSNTLDRIRSVDIAAATPSAGNIYVTSPAAGTSGTCTATFSRTGRATIPVSTPLYDSSGNLFPVTVAGTSSSGDITVTFSGQGFPGNITAGATLTIGVLQAQFTVVATSSSGILLTFPAGTDWESGTKVRFATTDTLPTGLVVLTDYWLIRVSATTARVASSYANFLTATAIAYTDAGTGTHSCAVQTQAPTVVASSSSGILLTFADMLYWTGQKVRFTTSGTLPTGLALVTDYYLIKVSASTARVATSLANALAGTAIAYTDAGTGTHTMTNQTRNVSGTVLAPGITGLVNRHAAVDITPPKIISANRKFNGDTRTNVFGGNTGVDSSVGINAILENEATPGSSVVFDPVFYRLDRPIVLNQNVDTNQKGIALVSASEARAFGSVSNSPVFFCVPNDAGAPAALWLACSRVLVRGIGFQMNGGTAFSMVEIGKYLDSDPTGGINFNRFEKCFFYRAGGTCDFGLTVGGIRSPTVQLENCSVEDTVFQGFNFGAYLTGNSQAYTTNFTRVSFYGGVTYGVGIRNSGISNSIACFQCDFQSMEQWVVNVAQTCSVEIYSPQSEHCKRIATTSGPLKIVGGRIASGAFTTATANFSALDQYYIDATDSRVDLDNVSITNENTQPNCMVRLGPAANLHAKSCVLPGPEVFLRSTTDTRSSGPWVTGCSYVGPVGTGSQERIAIPDFKGRMNSAGVKYFFPGETSKYVTFATKERDLNTKVNLSVSTNSGAPAVGSSAAKAANVTQLGFDLELDVDPSPGSLRVDWSVELGEKRITNPNQAMSAPLFAHWNDQGINLSGGAVDNWVDRVSSKVLLYSGTRPAYTASNANLNNFPTIDFTATAMVLNSTLGASSWEFLSNGTDGPGFTFFYIYYHAVAGTHNLVFSTTDVATTRGLAMYVTPVTLQLAISRGDGTFFSPTRGSYTAGKRWLSGRFASNTTLDNELRGNLYPDWVAGAHSGLAAGTPKWPLKLQNQDAANAISVSEVIVYNGALSRADFEAVVNEYIVPRYSGFP